MVVGIFRGQVASSSLRSFVGRNRGTIALSFDYGDLFAHILQVFPTVANEMAQLLIHSGFGFIWKGCHYGG